MKTLYVVAIPQMCLLKNIKGKMFNLEDFQLTKSQDIIYMIKNY